MRIACVHVPQFALQSLTRLDPSLRGAAVAVVGAPPSVPGDVLLRPLTGSGARALHTPVVQACSRAAWALGVRIGMTAVAANALAVAPGQLRVVTADAVLERETVRAIADAVLGLAAAVDTGGRGGAGSVHLALYCEVPSKTRGASFGDRLVEVLAALGLTARIGIADDRFTAWVAAAHAGVPGEETGVIAVPRGGSAAFLAPRPLALLSISPEVQHMLEALGVRTLGEFAALPAPSVARPIEADYQALARGDSGHALRPYAPEAPIREEVVCGTAALSGPAAVAALAQRIAARLHGRGRGAARLEVTAVRPDGERVVPITPLMAPMAALGAALPAAGESTGGHVLETAEELAEAIGHALADDLATATRLRVLVSGEAVAGDDVTAPEAAATVDALSVVLSTTGAAAWQLTSPSVSGPSLLRSERRDAHRRTQRGKHQRRARGAVEAGVQPRLFADRR